MQITLASSITAQIDPDKAILQLQHSLEVMEEEKDFAGAVFVYAKMAEIYLNEMDYSNSITLLKKAYILVQEHSLYFSLESGECHLMLSRYFYLNQEFTQAIEIALKSSEIFGRIAMIRDQVMALKIAVDCYERTNDYEEAFKLERKRNELLQHLSEERS